LVHDGTRTLSALALGAGIALVALPAHADDVGDLKALIRELKAQVAEEKSQVKELRSQLDALSSQVKDQKTAVSAQGAQVESQSQTLQKVEAQQQVLAQKQQAVTPTAAAATQPGYIAVPGTATAFKIGGYAKFDIVDDVKGNIGSSSFTKTATDFTAIPLDHSVASHRDGQVNFTAQESRLNLTTLTDTDGLGPVKTFFEGDFYNVGGGNLFRLRHAYLSAGSWTAGQTWSTFADLDTAGPETLDFNGPVGWAAVRLPQLRYTAKVGSGSVDLAVQSPSGDLTSTTADNHIDRAPDLVARYTVDTSWGHLGFAGLGRYLASDSGLPGPHPDKTVWGVLAGIGIKTGGKDQLVFQTVDGNGIGRYLEQGQGVSAVLVNNSIKPINIWGGVIGYTHYWTDGLRTNLAYGYDHFATPSGDSLEPIKSLTSVHANLIWSPWKATDVGIEYIFGQIETSGHVTDANGTSADKGTAQRIEGSVKYSF